MDIDNKIKILRELADNLSIWKKAGPKGPEQSEYVCKAAVTAKKLLWKNVNLLHYCGETYKCKSYQAKLSLDKLNWAVGGGNLTLDSFSELIGEIDYEEFANDNFINECKLWANKIEKGTERKWTQPKGLRFWSDVYEVSESTMRRYFKLQKIPNQKLGRFWRVDVNQLPQEIVEKIVAEKRKEELNNI